MTMKEAIEIIKKMVADGHLSQEVAEKYFPQFNENEDEKIRKVLIGWINLEPSTSFNDTFDGFSKEQILAWLEKQGEKKDYYTKQQLRDMGFAFTLKGDIVTPEKTIEAIKEYIAYEKKKWEKEQKPVIVPKFRVGDVITDGKEFPRCTIEEIDEQVYSCDYTNIDIVDADKNWKLVEQKTEWSEEDEEKFRDVIRLVEQGAPVQSIRDHYTNWLKSLKERVRPQNTWKPSEEQLDTLEIVKRGVVPDGWIDTKIKLNELYEQLKEL